MEKRLTVRMSYPSGPVALGQERKRLTRPRPATRVLPLVPQVLKRLQREKKRNIARAEEHYVHRSLCCLESSSHIRERLIQLVEWPVFNRTIIVFIILNCVALTLEDPVCKCSGVSEQGSFCKESEKYLQLLYAHQRTCELWPEYERVLFVLEIFFTVCFAAEAVIKIVARGLILHKHAYLKDPWNRMDLVIVCTGIATISFAQFPGLSFLRVFRVLRPLKTLTRIQGMKALVGTFMRSFTEITKVFTLLLFFMCFYGILGIELLSKDLRGRCYVDFSPSANNLTSYPAIYSRLISQRSPFEVSFSPEADGICSMEDASPCEAIFIDGVELKTVCSHKKVCISASACVHVHVHVQVCVRARVRACVRVCVCVCLNRVRAE